MSKIKKTPLELMREIRDKYADDPESEHSEADALLCRLVREYAPNGREVVKEYRDIWKWYG